MDKYTKTADSYLLPVLDIWSREKEQTVCPISGSCMSPIVKEGDSLVLLHGNQGIRAGDIAVYGEPGGFYVHRVIKIQRRQGRNYYVLKPDRNFNITQDIGDEKIIAKVIGVRGPHTYFDFNSLYWRVINPLLAIVFYTYWRMTNSDSVCGQLMSRAVRTFQMMKPADCSMSLGMLKIISRAGGIWSRAKPY